MKKIHPLSALLFALAAPPLLAAEPGAGPPAPPAAPPAVPAAKPASEEPLPPAAPRADGRIVCEWRDVQPKVVIEFLARKLGFAAVVNAENLTPVSVVSKEPKTPMEALNLLNGVLADRGFSVLADPAARQLRLLPIADARAACPIVATGADPDGIPADNMLRTQILPLSNLDADKTLAALTKGGLVDAKRIAVSAVKDTNAIVVTDTGVNVRRLATILRQLDRPAQVGEQSFRVFRLRFASAQRMADVFKTLFTGADAGAGQQPRMMFGRGGFGGEAQKEDDTKAMSKPLIAADPTTNTLAVRADPSLIERMQDLIAKMDVDGTAASNILVHRVHNGKSKDLANALYQLFQGRAATTSANRNGNGGGGGNVFGLLAQAAGGSQQGDEHKFDADIRVVSEDSSNSVVIFAPDRCFSDLAEVLKKLDIPKRQVFIRALVAEIGMDTSLDYGVELTGFHPRTTPQTKSTAFTNFNLFNATTGVNGYLIDNQHFQAALRAVQSCTRTDVLATPSILTMDNQQGKINVGQQISIKTSTVTTPGATTSATAVTDQFAYKDVGITLTVTPQINDLGLITMALTQEMTSLVPSTDTAAGAQPTINTRSMTTNVVLREGQTAILGGLIQDTASNVVTKVPLLGDIPGLGELFKRTTKATGKTELVIFLTPMLVEHPEDIQELSQHLRYDTRLLDDTIEPGLLQRHLERMGALKPRKPQEAPDAPAPAPGLLHRRLDNLRQEPPAPAPAPPK